MVNRQQATVYSQEAKGKRLEARVNSQQAMVNRQEVNRQEAIVKGT